MIRERIQKLVNKLNEKQLYGCLVFSSDFHSSEYIVDYFKARAFLSGFTGSAGTLLVTIRGSYLWTDGRYFIQAEQQLQGSGIQLMKMGESKTPTINEFLKQDMQENEVLAFDARVATYQFVQSLKQYVKNIQLKLDEDIVDELWENRPMLPQSKMYELPLTITGESVESKLEKVRKEMDGIDYHLLSSLDDIAYLFNLRGSDIPHNPVFLSYALISNNDAILFVNEDRISAALKESLSQRGVKLLPYNDIYSMLKKLTNCSILLDPNRINYALFVCLNRSVKIIKNDNPTTLMKSIKNAIEIENSKRVHIQDGVAFTKFMYQIKNNIATKSYSEISAEDLLASYRKQQKDYLEPSFDTICAYKEHAAIMHYSATPESNKQIFNEGLLLIDSGGQYMGGTTDITRTLAFNLSKEERTHFTLALKSHIDLAKAVFLRGCRGISLDILARKPLWDVGLDYKCGTGHGVGYMLSVHEGPNSFRYNMNVYALPAVLKEGMITTNEPGVYIAYKHGIRHENEMLTIFAYENDQGEFLKFEPITYAPFDLDGIDVNLLDDKEKQWLNDYHKMVFETLKPYLEPQEIEWLKKYTRAI